MNIVSCAHQKQAIMKLTKHIILGLLIGLTTFSCNKDDDNDSDPVVTRDEAEVAIENEEAIRSFLETHFYTMVPNELNSDYQIIKFDTIAGVNSGEESLMESPFLKTKIVTQNEIDYTLFYLQIREGAETEPKPTFADLAVVTYRGQLLNLTKFDESVTPVKFNLPGENGRGGIIKGFRSVLTEFRGATEYTGDPDGMIDFSDDYGIGAVFIPSGLGYFASSPTGSGIPAYSPLIFTFQLYKAVQGDADGDGIPSVYEDLNDDGLLYNDFSDEDNIPDFADADDDGDGTPTADEIVVKDLNQDGYITKDEITYTDSNGEGTPDYLDPEVK